MVPWWNLLVFLFSIGFAQKNCGRTRVDIPAPVFGPGDNFSAEGCGYWNQNQESAPWFVWIREQGNGCGGVLLSPTSVLMSGCSRLTKRVNVLYSASVGKCASRIDVRKCSDSGKGQRLRIRNVTQLDAPGYPRPLYIWTIREVTLKKNYIAPICLSNTGNQQDYNETQQYTIYPQVNKGNQYPAKLSEDFGPCLNQSKQFKTCDKVHENFLCARSSGIDYWGTYLTHQVKNRHFLRALVVEERVGHDLFVYDLYPLLDQIASLTGITLR